MTRKILALAIVSAATAILGACLGTIVSAVVSSGPCLVVTPGPPLAGAALGAGIGATIVLGARPDPRACNRQDPPFPPADSN